MLRTTIKSYYSNLVTKKVTDSKTFRKKIIRLFTKKALKSERITLIENGKNISNDTELFYLH